VAGTTPSATGTTTAPRPRRDWAARAWASLRRYRVLALITGVTLLIFTVELVLKYGFGVGGPVMAWFDDWFAQIHGLVYIVYLVTVVDLWSTMRWGFGRLTAMVLAGVVPFLSFVVERRIHARGEEQVATGRPAARAAASRTR
jgi:integral membrane protein